MDDKLETLQAEDQLAVSDPQAYLVSNPTPRDWNLSTQDIARSIRIDDPRKMLGLTNEDIQGPRKLSMIETIGKGIWDNITDNPIKESNETRMFYSSPNMTEEEATRLMNDVLYTDYKRREAEIAKDAAQIKYKKTYGFSNGVGSAIKYAFLGFLGGPTVGTAAIGALAGAESAAQVETDLADRYIDKYGKNYTKEEMWKDTGLASAYGAFAGFTEASLGIERIAAGALGRYSKLEALSRLARMEGKIYKSGALKAARRIGMSGVEEGGEEFIQSLGEDATVALAGYASDLTADEVFSKAFTSAIYGAMIGGTMGWGLYRINRKSIIDKIKKWNDEKGAGLNDQQVVEMADQMLDDGKTKMLDEVATRVEIRNHYGKAYDLVKKRLMDQINATETVPWQDKAKTKEEYVETLADALTFPAINVANQLQIPLSDFLEIADVESWVIGNIVGFKPIRSVGDIDEIIAKQDAIIKDQREKKKLGIGNEQVLSDAQRRKTIAQRVRREVAQDQEIAKRRANSKKQTADYITARDVQPASVEALAGATTAQPGQDFVLVAGKKIPVEYQVVELSTIQPSHINGTPNPNYTNEQLQNRASRGTQQDVADLRGKALPENFTPERITRANTAAEGAPLVNAAGEVIAGNGRAEIVRYAYENPESAEKYKASLIEQGFNIEGMEQPILVRRNTTLTPDEQVAAADISNISETSAFDEASQARRDTQYLKDSATPTEFAAKLPMSDRRGLMQNNGRWNKRRVQQRYESALLSWLCGNNTQLFENLVLDRGISQKVIDVLTANGNLIYETATKYPELNLREDIYNALVKMQYTTKNNFLEITQQLSLDGHDVMPENILVWNWLYADGTTNRQFMNYYATTLANNQERVNAGEDMFGQKVAPLSKKDALIQALKKSDQAKAETSASNGRNYEPLFDDNGQTQNPELLAAIISYNNQFAPTSNLNQKAYTSGATYYDKPSTEYVLRGGEGQIVHGWGIYSLADPEKNKRRYREGQFSGRLVFVPNMPKYQQLIKGAKNQKESQIFKLVLDTIAGRTPINMGKMHKFMGNPSAYNPIFYIDALYEVMGNNANKADKQFLEQVLNKGQFADETVFKVDPKMSKWLQRAILQTLDMHNDLKNSKFYQKDLPYIFVNTLTLNEVQSDFLDFIKKEFKHKDLNARANKALSEAIVAYVQDGGRIEYEPFDNRIFEESGAQVIDFKEMESDANIIIERMRDTMYGGYREMALIDDIIKKSPEQYSGYLGLAATISKVPFSSPVDLMYRISSGKTTLATIEEDPDFKHMKDKVEDPEVKIVNPEYKFLVSIIKSAKKTFDSKKFKAENSDLPEDAQTWLALSQAMRDMNQKERDALGLFLFTRYRIPEAKLDIFIQMIQHPENIKTTRGQQLEIDVPEDDVLLDEDLPLAKQAAADKLREIVKNFHWSFSRAFVDNIREKSWIQKHLDSDWKLFASKHGIKEKTLAEFAEKLDNEFYNGPMVDTMTPERELFIDYIMQTMHGDGLYQAIADILPETYIQLESGEEIGEVKDYDGKQYNVMGAYMPAELARDVALYLNDQGIKGIAYTGGIDGRGYVTFSDEAIKTLNRIDDEKPMYYQKRGRVLGQYDPELQTIMLGKYWNELTLVHEFHHRYLELMWGYFKQAQLGQRTMPQDFINDLEKLFGMLEINPNQESLTTVQQEKFTYMVEAYLTGLGVENTENLAFQGFLHWIPEKYKSIMDLGYLDENNIIQNPMLDEESIAWFNKWFASPFAPSLPSAPDAQRMINPTDNNGEILPADQKTMNNREKEWGQDSEEQLKADAQLWRAIDENMAGDARAAIDGEKELMKAETKNLPDDTKLPEQPKQTLREKWFKARVQNARERAAEMARKYVAENPEHARELAFADPETMTEYDAPVDQGMLIRAVMETVPQGSEEWYLLDNNLAMVKSMSGSTLALSGDQSHQAYLDAKREIEAARELKAATNYAGTSQGAMEKWNADIRAFIAARTAAIVATEPESAERQAAIKAMLEEAKTKFSANTTNAILNQLDLTGMRTKDSQVFIKWAEKQIKQAAHARIDTKEQQELMKASIAAQLALKDIDSTEVKDGKYVRAMQSGKDIRHWQFVKDKMKKAYIGRWGKFGIFMDNLFGSYAPSAMLMSVNTLFFANVPSTAVNTATTRIAAHAIGKNLVDSNIQSEEIKRIKQVFNASGVNLAQMDKPTSPSMLHGEKYTNQEQKHWYNFTFDVLGREDNVFRVPTFVDALARIATKNANGDKAKANALFKEYCQLNTTSEEAKIARKQALAVANMAVFTQDGIMASALNHIRSSLNTMSRGLLGLQPNGFGLGNILAPFLKTGANITEMGLSATLAPVRLVMTAMQKLQGKEIPDVKKIALLSDWINLAWMSVVIAVIAAINSDDDEWYIEPYQPGQAYDPDKPYDSVNFGGVWVKVDIFGPLAIPLRAAMKAVNGWEKRKMAAVADGLFFGGMEALSDTPLVNQVTDSSLDYMVKKPGAYWQGFGYNQLNKLVPSQLKSISRATTRGANVQYDGEWMGKTIGKKFHRNYGLDGQRLTTNDLLNILTNRVKVKND